MHEAQKILLSCLEAPIEKYVALPAGSGCTGAIEKALNILKPSISDCHPSIFITPYEHHSNILPWIEFFENLSVLDHDKHGNILLEKFEEQIMRDDRPKIISISAASNVTSQETQLKEINSIISTFLFMIRKNQKSL